MRLDWKKQEPLKRISAIWWTNRVTSSGRFMCNRVANARLTLLTVIKEQETFYMSSTRRYVGYKSLVVCSVQIAKSHPPPPLPRPCKIQLRVFNRTCPRKSESSHKHILLPPCFLVFLLCLHPCCQLAPTLPYPVANNIPLLCPQLSQTARH